MAPVDFFSWQPQIVDLLDGAARGDFDRLTAALLPSGAAGSRLLLPYGSLINGSCEDPSTADLDVTILEKHDAPPDRDRDCRSVATLSTQLREAGYVDVDAITTGARKPVLRFMDGGSGRRIDLTVENRHAVKNSLLVRQYIKNPRCLALVKRVKEWAKQKGLILDKTNGLLSSYGYTLLVICFLQRRRVIAVFAPEDVGALGESLSVASAPAQAGGPADHSVAVEEEDFVGFIQFLASRIFAAATGGGRSVDVLSIRDVSLDQGRSARQHTCFSAIEDPYEPEQDRGATSIEEPRRMIVCRRPVKLRDAVLAELQCMCSRLLQAPGRVNSASKSSCSTMGTVPSPTDSATTITVDSGSSKNSASATSHDHEHGPVVSSQIAEQLAKIQNDVSLVLSCVGNFPRFSSAVIRASSFQSWTRG